MRGVARERPWQPVDAAIALLQTLGPAEAIGRAVAHAKLFEASDSAAHHRPAKAFWPFGRIVSKQSTTTSPRSGTSYERRR